MYYAFQIGLSAIIYVLSFMKFVSAIQQLLGGGGGGYIDTQTVWRPYKPTFIFSK
jgi:hypothetical protein